MDYYLTETFDWLAHDTDPRVRIRKFLNWQQVGDGWEDIADSLELCKSWDHPEMPQYSYILEIPDGIVYGDIGLILDAKHFLLRDSAIHGYLHEPHMAELSEAEFYHHNTRQLPGRVATIASEGSYNYVFWLLHVLPRLHLLERNGEHYDTLLTSPLTQPFHRECLDRIGVPRDRVIELEYNSFVRTGCLVFPSYIDSCFSSVDKVSLQWVRSLWDFPKQETLKIFVSRRRAAHRWIPDEEALFSRLEPMGFQSVVLESLTVAEQAELFSQTAVVVSPHGASLANLVFCPEGARVVELFCPHATANKRYQLLAEQMGLMYTAFVGDEHPLTDPDPARCDIVFSHDRLLDLLKFG